MKKIILLILMSFISALGYSQLNEGFEGAPATPDASGVWALPSSATFGNWLVTDNRTNAIPNWRSTNPVIFPPNTGANCAFIDRENTGPGVLAEEWLITPQINVLPNSQFRFFTRQTQVGDPGTRYQIRVSNSATQGNLLSFSTILAEYTETELSTLTSNQLDYEEKIINLTISGARYFAFVKVFTQPAAVTSGDRWLVDDVRIIQQCFDPVAPLGVTAVSATGATLTWSSTTSTQFQIEYGESGFVQGTGTTTAPFTSTTTPKQYVIPSGTLSPSTAYQFYVRSVCADSNSQWVGPFNFTTTPLGSTCAAPIVVTALPYSNTSNTSVYGNNVAAASPGATGCGTTGAFLGGSDVVYTYTPTATGFLNISMNPGTATNTGVFVYSSCANIGTSCIGGVANATATVRTIPALAVTINVPIYIVISSTTATASFSYNLIIQEVTCPNPASGTASTFGTSSGTLSWTNGTGSTATSWEVAIQTAGSGIPTASDPLLIANTNTNFPVSGLNPATAYQYWVRADCGNGLFSIWSGPYLFNTTICDVADQCNYTFTMTDTFGDGWNNGTMHVRQNGIIVATLTGPTDAQNTTPIDVVVPMCNNIPFDLFWATGGTFPGEIRISIKNPFNQPIYAMTTSSAALAGTVLYAGTIDCDDPLCLPPTGLTVPVATIGTNNAVINWTSSGVPTIGTGIYVVLAGSPPPSPGTSPDYTVNAPTTTFTIPGLTPDTAYTVYIRSLCSVNGPSEWITTGVNFTTLPTCPKPTNVTITDISDTSVTVNWVNNGAGTSWQVMVLPSPSSLPLPTTGWLDAATTSLMVTGLTPGTTYDFYVRAICPGPDTGMPTVAVSATTALCPIADQCSYIFTVTDTFGDGWNGGIMQVRQNGVVVATLTGPTNDQNQTPIQVLVPLCTGVPFDLFWSVAGTFPGEIRVSITNTFNQVLYNMSTASANLAGTVLYSDSAADCQFPKCLRVTALTVQTNTFTATLNWTSPTENTAWDVYVVPSPSTAPTVGTIPTYNDVPAPPFVVTGLNPATAYDFYVRSNCAIGNPGDWVLVTGTTLPTCPQPTNLNYVNTYPDHAELVWTEVGPATSWSIVIQTPGGPVPTTGAGCVVTTLPTLAAPYNTDLCPGSENLAPGFYEFYVQSNCTTDDNSAWSGPHNFFISPEPLECASVEVNVPADIDFCPGESCIDLAATFTDSRDTTEYTVLPVAFAPPFPFTGGTQLNIATDDIWGPVFTLPFNFCFFGTNYPTVQVGSNGVISFTTTTDGANCPWNTTPGVDVPNPAFPIRNAIYGVYQDINPAVATPVPHSINYQVLGVAPCRTFVVNFLNIAQFSCGISVGLQTSQIVLYETSNIIEVYVQDRTSCTTWNEGAGVIGIQNAAGTIGYVPPGRNLGPWEAHNEAWRFTPNGASNVAFSWLQNGQPFSTDPNINVCVSTTTTMTAQAVYTGCGGQITTKTKDVLLRVNEIDVAPIEDVTTCVSYTLPALPVGNYFAQPNGQEPITNAVITATQTIYAFAQTATTPVCTDEESFTVTIEDLVAPPVSDVDECVSYTLPPLDPPFNYYSQPNQVGPLTGPITQTQLVYVAGQTEFCSAETSFMVNIGAASVVDQEDLLGCISVTLPALPANQSYYAQTGGPTGGTPITNLTINSSQTIYIFAQVGNCTNESMFEVIIDSSIEPVFAVIPNVCVGAPAPVLPLTSQNSITGTWSPATVQTTTAGTTVYTFTPDGTIACAVPTTISVTVDPPVVPTFDPIADVCLNAPAPILPTTSLNGVVGTWTPAAVNTSLAGTFTFTFTPNPDQTCAVPTTLDVTVISQIIPVFNAIANVCQNTAAPVLPTTSVNGVIGTWLPDTINTSAAGTVTYVFTPDLSISTQACALPTTLTVTVDPEVIPVFAPLADICLNDVAPTLPLTSTNGVTGTWSPTAINTSVAGTVTYTFTPDAGQVCALNGTLNVTITAPAVPDFTSVLTLCSGDAPPLLAGTSPNGISGTWSPATISNMVNGCYVFTPTAGLCALPQTICVTINLIATPDFPNIAAFCANTTAPVLAGTSPNGIAGTWSPSVISNVADGCYVFTPNAGQCATSQQLCVTVNPILTPNFGEITGFCVGENPPLLSNSAPNGVTGTWSPSTVSNTQTGEFDYVFTPDGPCGVSQTLSVTVSDVPGFTVMAGCLNFQYQVYVFEDMPGVTYSWTLNGQEIEPGDTRVLNITQSGLYEVTVSDNGCSRTEPFNVMDANCEIQKGISPKGNGGDNKNDFFDLAGRNVKQLDIFNRYGTKVYTKANYINEWYGQSDKGEELPDGTYFYALEYNNGTKSRTGWIYINREQ